MEKEQKSSALSQPREKIVCSANTHSPASPSPGICSHNMNPLPGYQ